MGRWIGVTEARRPWSILPKVRSVLVGAWGGFVGLLPHLLHHVGPLAGAAVLAGAGGTALFAAVGLIATVPTLRRIHRRFGTWRAPGVALGLFAMLFAVSNLVVGPAISGDGKAEDPPAIERVDPAHDGHH